MMTTDQARQIFNTARDRTADADARARIELVREFFCNPAFRHDLSVFVAAKAQDAGK